MDLDQYLTSPGALTISQLRKRMDELGYPIKSNAQLRQWRHKYSGRVPNAENCVGLEKATDGKVRREDMRPTDWWRIWPELKGAAELQVDTARSTDDAQPPTGGRSDRRTKSKGSAKSDSNGGN